MIALIVVAALSVQTFVYVSGEDRQPANADSSSSIIELEDRTDESIVADISNLTGISSAEIIQIKQTGLSWQEVLEKLKSVNRDTTANRELRDKLLTEGGIEEIAETLRAQGYDNEQITESKLLAERVAYQLSSIVSDQAASAPHIPQAGQTIDSANQAIEHVAGQFDVMRAIQYTVVLEQELGSLEAAFNEYLLSLQLGIDIELLLTNSDVYDQQRTERIAGMLLAEYVTIARIEEAMLVKVNAAAAGGGESDNPVIPGNQDSSRNAETSSPSNAANPLPLPEVPDVKPVNPAERLKQELDALNPNIR